MLSAKKAKHGNRPLFGTTAVVTAFFILSTSFLALQYHDVFLTTKATVLADNTDVFASPSTEAPALISFSEGSEVTLLRRQSNWAQVRRLDNEVGWIPMDKIYIHSGHL